MPPKLSLTRRGFLGSSAVGLFLTALPQQLLAQNTARLTRFMSLSQFVTGHGALDPRTGQGLLDGLSAAQEDFDTKARALETKISATNAPDVETLAQSLEGDPLHDTLLAIVAAWYSGVTTTGSDATVYAFDTALMYQPARDAVPIPTYALDGPNWWVVAPPALSDMPAFGEPL
ncbi:sugar dehydrogenase complex small subunit [Thioclava sp. GXIMD2076]|uniref:Sugar dehydrogenase complex small subunit n=1 Tax=Thioclava kandeliae TaxID=3070818 RepID=A0ABV1SJ59_9RHOB